MAVLQKQYTPMIVVTVIWEWYSLHMEEIHKLTDSNQKAIILLPNNIYFSATFSWKFAKQKTNAGTTHRCSGKHVEDLGDY